MVMQLQNLSSTTLPAIVVLVTWTCVMWGWMYSIRNPILLKNESLNFKTQIGFTGRQLDELLPQEAQWKAHNYNHLHEQPTLFYAIALCLTVTGHGGGWSAALAWGYVFSRIAHSLYQSLFNRAKTRFILFVIGSSFLFGLTAIALYQLVLKPLILGL